MQHRAWAPDTENMVPGAMNFKSKLLILSLLMGVAIVAAAVHFRPTYCLIETENESVVLLANVGVAACTACVCVRGSGVIGRSGG
jgi:hypothetical protein